MLKAILLILVLLLAYWLFFGGRHKQNAASDGKKNRTMTPGTEKMVVCAHCHLHIPESESIASAGHHFCCDEHRRLGPT